MKKDHGLIGGLDKQTARDVLAAAERAGVDPRLVRTSARGFVVPNKVIDEYEKGAEPEKDAEPAKPAAKRGNTTSKKKEKD